MLDLSHWGGIEEVFLEVDVFHDDDEGLDGRALYLWRDLS